jgi:SAM-dependent methyltransferase
VLTDSDVAVCEDPRQIPIPPGRVGMTPVHLANPPLAVLEQVFAAAGLPLPHLTALQLQPGELTVAGNGNGGLYVVDGPRLAAVAGAWAHWARWLLDRQELLASWALHTDQVAMALALAAAGIPVCDLDIRWNLPTHVPAIIPAAPPVPAVVHYHRHVDAAGRLLPTGRAAIDRQIAAANAALDGLWRQSFPNATFWQWRYLTDPALGSGTGSRGQRLREKRALLAAVIDVLQPASTLDAGCGDGAATAGLPLPGYTGLDLSAAAIERARAGRPDGRFEIGPLTGDTAAAELVLCLDVLLHQAEAAAYEQLVRRLLGAAVRALVVSGYERPFQPSWATVHFHEPLSATLRRAAPAAEIHLLREEGEISTFLVLQPAAAGAGAATLAALIRRLARREERLGEIEAQLAAATAEAELARQEAARLAAECRAHAATARQTATEVERWRERVAALESTRAFRLRAWLLRLRHGGKP